jgi:hypothetical protein
MHGLSTRDATYAVQNGHIHLPNTSNSASTPDAPPAQVSSPNAIPFQRDAPPHTALSFEAIRSEVHTVQITDTAWSTTPEESNNEDDSDSQLYKLSEVLAIEKAEQLKQDSRPPKPQNSTPPPPPVPTSLILPPTEPPVSSAQTAPQYRFPFNAEDRQHTTKHCNLEDKPDGHVDITAISAPPPTPQCTIRFSAQHLRSHLLVEVQVRPSQ